MITHTLLKMPIFDKAQQAESEPQTNGMPLTEYAAEPLPADLRRSSMEHRVPKDYILPDGYPDVSHESR